MAFQDLSENIMAFVESFPVCCYKVLKLGHIFWNTLYNLTNGFDPKKPVELAKFAFKPLKILLCDLQINITLKLLNSF